ncbi:MAG: hypothetical protein MZV70_30875 [Desulfobacterales bacterium]|nr:hypothetical protein [Desulfobacterales bacterium]
MLKRSGKKARKEAGKDTRQSQSRKADRQILAAAGKRVGEIKLAAEAESAKQTAHIIGQEVSAANLLVKRELLNTQKALLDQVYEATRMEIAALPESFHREAIKKLLTEAQKEISQGKIYCNARDVAAVKGRHRRESRILRDSRSGHLSISMAGSSSKVKEAALQIDYSYRTFLAKVWESGLKDASDILFG